MYGFPRNNYNWIFQKNMTTKLNDLKHDCVAIMMNFVAQARWAWCTFIILCLHMILMWFSWQKCVCNNCSDSGYFWRIWIVKLNILYFWKIIFIICRYTNTQNIFPSPTEYSRKNKFMFVIYLNSLTYIQFNYFYSRKSINCCWLGKDISKNFARLLYHSKIIIKIK